MEIAVFSPSWEWIWRWIANVDVQHDAKPQPWELLH